VILDRVGSRYFFRFIIFSKASHNLNHAFYFLQLSSWIFSLQFWHQDFLSMRIFCGKNCTESNEVHMQSSMDEMCNVTLIK
jgi:hypothetical protein